MQHVWSPSEVRALGVRTDLETANSILGLNRFTGYELARSGTTPSRCSEQDDATSFQLPVSLQLWTFRPKKTSGSSPRDRGASRHRQKNDRPEHHLEAGRSNATLTKGKIR